MLDLSKSSVFNTKTVCREIVKLVPACPRGAFGPHLTAGV